MTDLIADILTLILIPIVFILQFIYQVSIFFFGEK